MNRHSFIKSIAVIIVCPKWPDGKLGEGMLKVRPSRNLVDFDPLCNEKMRLRIKSKMPIKVELEFDKSAEFICPQKQEMSDGQIFVPKGRYMRVMITSKQDSEDKIDIWMEVPGILVLDEAA